MSASPVTQMAASATSDNIGRLCVYGKWDYCLIAAIPEVQGAWTVAAAISPVKSLSVTSQHYRI